MLHITLDPSIIEITGTNAVFSCTIAGVSEIVDDLTTFPDSIDDNTKSEYFPWNWELLRDAKLIWLGYNVNDGAGKWDRERISYIIDEINLELIQGGATNDKGVVRENYELVLSKLLSDKNKFVERKSDLKKDIPFSITDESKIEDLKGNVLSPAIAYYAQQLSPLNQQLGLSYFFNAIDDTFFIPENATHFAIYFEFEGYENSDRFLISKNVSEIDKGLLFEYTNAATGGKKQVFQPFTALASYLNSDFIGDRIQNYDLPDTFSSTPKNITNATFQFTGNTKLSVNDVSEMSNLSSKLSQEYSFDKLLSKALLKLFGSYQFDNDEKKENYNLAFSTTVLYYAKRLIENLGVSKEIIERNYYIFKDLVEIPDYYIKMSISDKRIYLNDFENIEKISSEISSLTMGIEWKDDDAQNLKILSKVFQCINSKAEELKADFLKSQLKISKEGVTNSMVVDCINSFYKSSIDAEDRFSRKFRQHIIELKEHVTILDLFGELIDGKINITGLPIIINDLYKVNESEINSILFTDWESHFSIPENVPPPLNIEVQEINTQTGADLINEISGHILLSRRSLAKGTKQFDVNDWKYLNWAKVSLDNGKNFLDGEYLIPAALPKINGTQKTSFHLSNESLSIIAGHDNHTGIDDVTYGENEFAMNFDYSFVDENGENGVPAAPALWYGHYYEFAGFVALNSGALPSAIRKYEKGVTLWNIPEVDDIVFDNDIKIASYYHLRRVPIGLPNISTDYQNHFPQVPLLVNELVKNTSDNIYEKSEKNKVEQKKITAFLLCEKTGKKDKQGNEIDQSKITITVDKPYTNFWNWYAYKGKDAKEQNVKGETLLNLALASEIDIKNKSLENKLNIKKEEENTNPYLFEPAIEDKLMVKVEQIFPLNNVVKDFTINVKTSAEFKTTRSTIVVKAEGEEIITAGSKISIPPGTICKVSIHCKIKKSLFPESVKGKDKKNEEQMFHHWMPEHIVAKDEKNSLMTDGDFYLTNPEVFYIETAIKNHQIIIDKDNESKNKTSFENELHSGLKPNHINKSDYGVFCTMESSNQDFITKFPYFSRCEVHHQVWRWNGRLFAEPNFSDNKSLDPDGSTPTTEAMKWEAWEFANRPDFTALVSNENITASFDLEKERKVKSIKSLNQMVFKDPRPKKDSQKAHYFRFGLKIYNRYESIGAGYDDAFQAQNKGSIWKRFLKKMQGTDEKYQLPKPAIRFAIPLTDALGVSTTDDNKVRAASLMIATYDRCFDEAGLAERFEVGIEITSFDNSNYLQAGEDPILSATAMPATLINEFEESRDGRKFVTFKPIGPAALTFDMLAQNPKVVGSTFIINVEDVQQFLPDTAKLNAYAMVKVAIRRVLKPEFVSNDDLTYDKLKPYFSDWSASEWVQLLPAVDSLIPTEWRNADAIPFSTDAAGNLKIAGFMPRFDDTFENCMERYLVISKKEYDIGEQPVEKYVGVYKWDTNIGHISFEADTLKNAKGEMEGYGRLMLVRKQKEQSDEETKKDIWEKLFGGKVKEPIMFGAIENDPLAAMPLVSKRLAIKKNDNQVKI